jgi:predicted RNA-binding Zn ribbon-like protein
MTWLMTFDGDEFVAGSLALDFVNTVGGDRAERPKEKLAEYGDVLDWLRASGSVAPRQLAEIAKLAKNNPDGAQRALRRTIQFREALYEVVVAVHRREPISRPVMDLVNREVARSLHRARLQYENHAFFRTFDGAVGLDMPLSVLGRDAGDLLLSGSLDRLSICEGENCGWLYLDLSKNRSRRWCNMKGCGNRAKLRRFRAKPNEND